MGKKSSSKATAASRVATTQKLSSTAPCNRLHAQEDPFPPSLLTDKPKSHLPYTILLPNYIWTVDGILSHRECQRWIDYMEQSPSLLEYTKQRATRTMASRECYRLQRNDSQTAQRIFDRIPKALISLMLPQQPPVVVGCNPNVRLYKYCVGHSFGMHVDESHSLVLPITHGSPVRGTTRITVLVYLSECQGGATRFQWPTGDIVYAPQKGSMLLHLHGDDCLPHQGDVVLGGIKYVLRTDLVCHE